MAIPNTIHFIFGMDEQFGGKPFSYIHYLVLRSALAVNKPEQVVLHYAFEPRTDWWEAVKPYVVLNRVTPPSRVFGKPIRNFAHRSDILRLDILRCEGGIYLDIDVFCVRSLRPLRSNNLVMGIELNRGLCNAVILAEPKAPFLDLWIESYREFNHELWNYHSVHVPYRLAQTYPHLIKVVDEYSFFFPMYDDPLSPLLWNSYVPLGSRLLPLSPLLWNSHSPLRRRLLGVWSDLKSSMLKSDDRPFRRLPYLHSVFWTPAAYYNRLRQSFCVHLWETHWWEPYLRDLRPDTLRSSCGLFRKLVDEILPDETRSL
jgi:hypothetical protein